jgi:hypothetical protein
MIDVDAKANGRREAHFHIDRNKIRGLCAMRPPI